MGQFETKQLLEPLIMVQSRLLVLSEKHLPFSTLREVKIGDCQVPLQSQLTCKQFLLFVSC